MKVKDFIGKEAIHKDYGRVLVTSAPPRSKTTVNIKVIQRGPGWDEALQKYKPVRTVRDNPDAGPGAKTIHYYTTRNDEYGVEDECHIKDLKLCE
jgi:hypothetical protein